MRKQKKFELMAIMEEFKKVNILENDTFYTRDTEAFLVFITEPNYEFDSATIALLNRDDGSLISVDQNPVVDGVTEYEMPVEVIAHYGKWNAQLIYHKGEEDYTSPLVSFTVERFLADSRPPRLTEVESVAKLVKQAKEIMDEYTDIVEDIMTAEADRVAFYEQAKVDEADRAQAEIARKEAMTQMEADKDAVIANATVDSEVILARGGKPTLQARLDETTAQLAQKANAIDTRKSTDLNPINVSEMDTETKQLFTGGAVAVVGENAVGRENLKSRVVSADKTDFLEIASTNLFDKDDVVIGQVVNVDTGALQSSGTFSTSNFIPVGNATHLVTNYQPRYGFYDSNYNFLEGVLGSSNTPIEVPPSAYYVRVSMSTNNLETAQINVGEQVLDYDTYKIKVKNAIVEGKDIKNLVVSDDDLEFIEHFSSTNLFNKYNVLLNKSINSNNGVPVDNDSFSLTEFIPAEEQSDYVSNFQARYGFYKSDYTFISSELIGGGTPIETPTSTSFIRVAVPNSQIDNVQINKSSELLPYEPYAFNLLGAKISYETKGDNSFESIDKFIINGKLDEVFSSPTIEGVPDLPSWRSPQMFDLYDELVSNYPDYVTKTILGQDGLGDNIYRYDFKPKEVDLEQNKVKLPKMILISGIHGTEKAGVYALYNSMKQICENWRNDESLETLRWNVHFIVVPIVNLYSFDGNSLRKNENGVDLARNFAEGWVLNPDPESPTYGGAEPLSEPGAYLIDQLLRENKDAVYFTSFHNFSTPPNNNYFIWNAGATTLQTNLGKRLVSKMTRKWKKEYDWLPQDETTYFGYASGKVNGSEGAQAAYHGIQGSTFEIGQQFFLEPDSETHSSVVYTLGTETFINWLILNLKHNVDFYNNYNRQ